MEKFDRKEHWERIYQSRKLQEVSWYQPVPVTSLEIISTQHLPLTARIIDIGGGDSLLADHLLDLGYRDITVLDISAAALKRAQERLGERSGLVKWIESDVTAFRPIETYDLWHDRAAFHFLKDDEEIDRYLLVATQSLKQNGILVLGTFSEEGPLKCSGLEIRQYTETSMTERLKKLFGKIRCVTAEHLTPANAIQHFIFCSFRKLAA